MLNIKFSKNFEDQFKKLIKKNKNILSIVSKKIDNIKVNPTIGENLSGNLKGIKSIHIDKSYILAFAIRGNKLLLIDIDVHDNAYSDKYHKILMKEGWN